MLKQIGILCSCLLAACQTFAADNEQEFQDSSSVNDLKKQVVLRLGGFYSNSNSSMKVVDPALGQDFKIDFEKDLNLEESQFLPFFEMYYHFNERHSLYIDWKQLHRSAEVQGITTPFQVSLENRVYDVKAGAKLKTTLNMDIVRLGYGYQFYQGNNYNLGLSLGLHTMFIKTGFEGDIGACIEQEMVFKCDQHPLDRAIDESVTAPLPDIGLFADYEFSPGFRFTAHAQYFYIKLDDLKGSLVDIRAGVETEITDNWHITAAFNYYELDVDHTQRTNVGDIHVADYNLYYSFIGPMLSVSYRF